MRCKPLPQGCGTSEGVRGRAAPGPWDAQEWRGVPGHLMQFSPKDTNLNAVFYNSFEVITSGL